MNAQKALTLGNIPTLEKELLLAHVLHNSRSWIAAHPEYELSEEEVKLFETLLKRREAHEPVSYIINEREFYGRSFYVNEGVLIPRPATEGLVDLTLDFLRSGTEEVRDTDSKIVAGAKLFKEWSPPKTVVDIGTGSGCIAITLALERTDLRIIATDMSDAALAVAEVNIAKHRVGDRVSLLKGSLLEPLNDFSEQFLLVSNPPYIPSGESLEPDVSHFEPHSALFAGNDGMDFLQKLWSDAREHLSCVGVVLECREDQWQRLLKL